jgi:hypothetical protein
MNKYLLIHGGRNDKEAYDLIGNIALNDICLLNLENRTWESLGMYNEVPESRYGHTMCVAPDRESILIFGGKNLLNYCPSILHTFNFK